MLKYTHADKIRALITGFLLVLAISVLRELLVSPLYIAISLVLIFLAYLLAKGTAKHFHTEHTHTGDSAYDNVAIGVLLLANFLHPAIDGFSFYSSLHNEGYAAGIVVGLGVLIHEIFRQSALAVVFTNMGFRPLLVVATACIGLAAGIGLGFYGNAVLETHEWFIDFATLFAYTFILSEFYISTKGHEAKKEQYGYLILGLVVGVFLSLTMH